MIFGQVKCGQGHRALELYQQMQHEVWNQSQLPL
jgi:pentatricopeptide repeat protein